MLETRITKIKDPVRRLFEFARERELIAQRRASGAPQPWTDDPILATYRFTRVYREEDRVTRWIARFWRGPNSGDPHLWFAMCVARLLNLPESMEFVGYPVPWRRGRFLALESERYKHRVVFSAAYMINAAGADGRSKVEYLADDVLDPLWHNREILRPRPGDTLNSYHMTLGQMMGFGSFMAAQVVADLKYVEPLRSASDWHTFAASGPGSRRGLNYVLGRGADEHWREDDWRMELGRLKQKMDPLFERAGMPPVHAQDLQNVLCEYSKIHKAWFESKMPKRKFRFGDAR